MVAEQIFDQQSIDTAMKETIRGCDDEIVIVKRKVGCGLQTPPLRNITGLVIR